MTDLTPDGAPHLDDPEQAEKVRRFWEAARVRANLTSHGGAVGESIGTMMLPPAWAFGDSPELADELLGLVLSGAKTATASLPVEYEEAGEDVPAKGALSILLDGAGEPRALIRTTKVETVPFDEVTAEFAALEAEDDGTLESWRENHERYWRRALAGTGHEFDPRMPVLCEQFKVLYAAG